MVQMLNSAEEPPSHWHCYGTAVVPGYFEILHNTALGNDPTTQGFSSIYKLKRADIGCNVSGNLRPIICALIGCRLSRRTTIDPLHLFLLA